MKINHVVMIIAIGAVLWISSFAIFIDNEYKNNENKYLELKNSQLQLENILLKRKIERLTFDTIHIHLNDRNIVYAVKRIINQQPKQIKQ